MRVLPLWGELEWDTSKCLVILSKKFAVAASLNQFLVNQISHLTNLFILVL